MNRIRPRLLTAEIMLCVIRLAVRDDHGRLAPGRVGAPDLVLIGDPGLVAPVDRRTLGLGALGDRRVVLLQPGRDRRGLALPGPRQRLLRGHAPALQVELHGRQAERLGEAQRDQVAHRARGPQGERQLQLVRRPVADPALDLAGLLGRQQPLAPPRRHPPAVEHAVLALRAVALQPDVDRLPLHADDLGRRAWLRPCCSIRNSARRRNSSCAARPMPRKSRAFHAQSIAARQPFVRYIYGKLVALHDENHFWSVTRIRLKRS